MIKQVNINHENIQFIFQLPTILKESGELGDMQWDIFNLEIKSLKEYQNDLIKLK